MEIESLVNIKSFDLKNNEKIIDYLISQFKNKSQEIIKIKNPDYKNKFNLLIGLNTKIENAKNAIILSGHIDTVVADETLYKTNPYIATKINNKLYGLGVIDMKCFFASIIENINNIKQLNSPIIIAISCDEETNLFGVNEIIKTLKEKNVSPAITIIGEPTNSKLATYSKSCFEYKITVIGKSCHSSNPKNGINSIYIISKLISFIEKLSKKQKNSTLNVGLINGGTAINIVPSFAEISFDIRSETNKEKNKCLNYILKKINILKQKYKNSDISILETLAIPPLEQRNSNLINLIKSKLNFDETNFPAASEAGYFQSFGGDAVLFGVGDITLAHKPNEFMVIEDYENYNKLFLSMLKTISENLNKEKNI